MISGTKSAKPKPGVKGDPGHFAMKFLNLRTRRSKFIVLPRQSYKDPYRFEIDSLKVNLKNGYFTIDPEEKDVMQMTALAFVTATLYLLVQPRPKIIADSNGQRGTKRVQSLFLIFTVHT